MNLNEKKKQKIFVFLNDFRFIKCTKKIWSFYVLDQILVNSNWELNLTYTFGQEKEMQKQKLAWFVGYLALCINRNMYKKHISASPTVSFSARTFKTFVSYLKVMINKFTISISIFMDFWTSVIILTIMGQFCRK